MKGIDEYKLRIVHYPNSPNLLYTKKSRLLHGVEHLFRTGGGGEGGCKHQWVSEEEGVDDTQLGGGQVEERLL